jgi:hypothetical protein
MPIGGLICLLVASTYLGMPIGGFLLVASACFAYWWLPGLHDTTKWPHTLSTRTHPDDVLTATYTSGIESLPLLVAYACLGLNPCLKLLVASYWWLNAPIAGLLVASSPAYWWLNALPIGGFLACMTPPNGLTHTPDKAMIS